MLTRFFRSSFLVQYVVLVITGVALWLPAFLGQAGAPPGNSAVSPLSDLILQHLPGLVWLPAAIALFFVLVEGFILNSIFIYHDLIPKNSLLPAFLFVLFMSSSSVALTLHPALLAMLPLTIFMHQLYLVYDEAENLNRVLGVGLLGAICSLLYAPLVLLIVYIWIVFLIYRTLQWRQWLIALLGFLLPFLYLAVYYFWMENLVDKTIEYFDYATGIFNITFELRVLQLSVWGVFILLMLFPSVFRIAVNLGSNNIAFRRKMAATIWLAVFGSFMVLIHGDFGYHVILFLPAAGIVASNFQSAKKSIWNELVLLSYLVLIAINNYLA